MSQVQLVEVGPRDGLQNEDLILSTDDKLHFIDLLAEAGFARIEATSFVHPKWVPQMADARDLYPRLSQREGLVYSALVPNVRGLESALEAGVREIAVFTAASETFNRKNINMGTEDSLETIAKVIEMAHGAGVAVRGYLSTCFGCPYEGLVSEEKVAKLSARLLALGCFEVSVSDTIGVATPGDVDRVLGVIEEHLPMEKIALHLHDTRGMALANITRALDHGIRVFDTAAGGAGGCPFAPAATGNIPTDDLLYMLDRSGIETGVDLEAIIETTHWLEDRLGRGVPAMLPKAGIFPQVAEQYRAAS